MFDEIRLDAPPCSGPMVPKGDRHVWVEPTTICEVRYLEMTDEHLLRHPVFVRLRDDKPMTDMFEDEPPFAEAIVEESEVKVPYTNLDKIFWPEEGYTKGDLLNYYELVAPALLSHLIDRPIMLVRHPDGVAGKSFYQWNTPQGTPEWIQTLQLRDEERDGKNVTTFLVDDVDSLLHIINLGCIPIHVLACQKQTREFCDFLTIDFDIGSQPFKEAVILALSLKELLAELGLEGFPKTSGQSGLHVMIPLGPKVPFQVAKVMVELIGRLLQMQHPETSTMERRISGRGERVYIDTGQTGRSRTIVAPYSVRAHRGATVSTPLFWEEVRQRLLYI